jgi:1-acyl-sn-glycerol-3-phosphate acyltransferase
MSLRYCIAWNFASLISAAYFGRTALHADRVPATGPCILAANHASFMDPFFQGSAVQREVFYLARSSAFWFPLGVVLRACNAVPMDREGGGLKGMLKIIDILKQGHAITLFPEGTRTPDGNLQSAKAGIGLIVIKSGAPVVPVRIFGAYEAWNRHMTLPRPRHMTVKYGWPLLFADLHAEAKTCSKERLKEIYQEVAVQIMAAIGGLEPGRDPK